MERIASAALVVATLLFTACSTSTAGSRELARLTLAEVVLYEKQIRDLNEVVSKSYGASLEGANRTVAVQQGLAVDSAQRALARTTAENFVDNGVRAAAFQKFLSDSLTVGAADVARLETARAELVAKSAFGDEAIVALEKKTKALRQKLEQLQLRSSRKEELSDTRALLQAAIDESKKNRSHP
jgi:hypothetical protein